MSQFFDADRNIVRCKVVESVHCICIDGLPMFSFICTVSQKNQTHCSLMQTLWNLNWFSTFFITEKSKNFATKYCNTSHYNVSISLSMPTKCVSGFLGHGVIYLFIHLIFTRCNSVLETKFLHYLMCCACVNAASRYCFRQHLSVCLFTYKLENYWSEIDVTW